MTVQLAIYCTVYHTLYTISVELFLKISWTCSIPLIDSVQGLKGSFYSPTNIGQVNVGTFTILMQVVYRTVCPGHFLSIQCMERKRAGYTCLEAGWGNISIVLLCIGYCLCLSVIALYDPLWANVSVWSTHSPQSLHFFGSLPTCQGSVSWPPYLWCLVTVSCQQRWHGCFPAHASLVLHPDCHSC